LIETIVESLFIRNNFYFKLIFSNELSFTKV
jgi:hypothetical protein